MDVQADLGLHCPHLPKTYFLHGAAHLIIKTLKNVYARILLINLKEAAKIVIKFKNRITFKNQIFIFDVIYIYIYIYTFFFFFFFFFY